MVATTVESLQLLLNAQRDASKEQREADTTSASPYRLGKSSSVRSASFVSSSTDTELVDASIETPRIFNRRGSTRDTLLDLLQQGKLGMSQQDSDREMSSRSLDDDSGSSRGSLGEDTSDYDAPKVAIAMKAYTVDIHDAQINVREENTRSNMLLASKHIHFEIGTDAGENNTVANLTFDNVTAHVAPSTLTFQLVCCGILTRMWVLLGLRVNTAEADHGRMQSYHVVHPRASHQCHQHRGRLVIPAAFNRSPSILPAHERDSTRATSTAVNVEATQAYVHPEDALD